MPEGRPRAKEINITIGDQKYTVQRFKGLKAIMAMAVLTRLARDVPDVMADAVKQYSNRNTVTITEAMARLPRWSGFSKEDFDVAEKATGKRIIEMPSPMTANEQIMYSLPQLLEGARREVVRLLALLLIPNEELRTADKEDRVEAALDGYEELLMGEAEIDELADLCLAAQDVVKEQLAERKDRLGNLMRAVWKAFFQSRQNQRLPVPPESPTSLQPSTDQVQTSQTLQEDAQTSSTDSEEPTDGVEKELSLTSPGSSS